MVIRILYYWRCILLSGWFGDDWGWCVINSIHSILCLFLISSSHLKVERLFECSTYSAVGIIPMWKLVCKLQFSCEYYNTVKCGDRSD